VSDPPPPPTYRIALINMPFARLAMPSIALTQLAAVLKKKLGTEVDIPIHYLNLDFMEYLGDMPLYNHTHSPTAFMTGIADWFFRQSAFPDAEDNTDAYYARYYHSQDGDTQSIWHQLEQKRAGLDAFLDILIDRYALLETNMVGFTTLFSQTTASIAMARRIKARSPDIATVIGGASCEAEMGMTLAASVPILDAVFSGPALESFPAFVTHLRNGDHLAWDAINGVFTQTNRHRWPTTEGDSTIGMLGDASDINDRVTLDYESFLNDLTSAFPNGDVLPELLFETSRGCWWARKKACSFCGLNGRHMQPQTMTAENAIAHIEFLYPYVARCRIFMAVDTSLPPGYTSDVFPQLTPPPGMNLFYELRPDVTKTEIQVLVDAGVRAFQPGIESLSTSSLRLMNKGITAFQNIIFLKNCSAHPVRVDWNLLVFSPGEDEAIYEKTLRDIPLVTHLAPPSGAYPVGFVRFSQYAQTPGAYGLDLTPKDFYGLTYPFDRQAITNLAYHFDDANEDHAHVNMWLDRLNAAVDQWTRQWMGTDGIPQARLCFASDDETWAIYDSRSGDELETEISAVEKRLLDALNRPRTIAQLQHEFGADTAPMLNDLRTRGWLFEEDDRFLSLVTQR